MIIKHLSLTNFGRHEKLKVNTEGSMVGLIGLNGQGKTTVLEAIKYAFTGTLKDPASTYIRNGADKAIVEVIFSKNGKEGIITRIINPSKSSRKLDWDGETLNSSKQVEAKLEEILGADKYAIQNAVFVSQGELDTLLFGSQTERENMFARVMNVAWIEKTGNKMDGLIKAYQGEMEDLTSLLDSNNKQVANAEDQMSAQKTKLDSEKDYTPLLDMLTDLRADLNVCSADQQSFEEDHAKLSKLYNEKANYPDIKDTEAITKINKEIEELNAAYKLIQEANNRNTQIKFAIKELDTARENGATLRKELTEINEAITENKKALLEFDAKDIDNYDTYIRNRNDYQRVTDVVEGLQEEVSTLEQNLKGLEDSKAELPTQEVIDNLHKNYLSMYTNITTMETTKDFLEKVSHTDHSSSSCPVCNSTLDGSHDFSEKIKQLDASINQSKLVATQVKANIENKTALLRNFEVNYQRVSASLTNKQQELNKNLNLQTYHKSQPMGPETIEDVDKLSDIKNRFNQLNTILTSHQNNLIRATDKVVEADSKSEKALEYKKSLPEPDPDLVGRDHEEVLQKIEVLKGKITSAQQIDKDITSLEDTLKKYEKKVSTTYRKTKEVVEFATEFLDRSNKVIKLPASREGFVEDIDNVISDVVEFIEVVSAKNKSYIEANAKMAQIQQFYKQACDELDDTKARIDKNLTKTKVIEDLKKMRFLLGRTGITSAFINHMFKQLLDRTQSNLTSLGANFIVIEDKENSVSFKFIRTDENDGTAMPMSKMSGGQKVLMSIAFLVAVQQLLLPELGFLTIDEPSSHLDHEKVEYLKDLLTSLNTSLNNMDGQVWVVDHHVGLESAFTKTVKL